MIFHVPFFAESESIHWVDFVWCIKPSRYVHCTVAMNVKHSTFTFDRPPQRKRCVAHIHFEPKHLIRHRPNFLPLFETKEIFFVVNSVQNSRESLLYDAGTTPIALPPYEVANTMPVSSTPEHMSNSTWYFHCIIKCLTSLEFNGADANSFGICVLRENFKLCSAQTIAHNTLY